jgi:IS30 family transposase
MEEVLPRKGWFPGQISGWIRMELDFAISHETISTYFRTNKPVEICIVIYGVERKKRYKINDRRGCIKNKVSINARSSIVNTHNRH